MAVHTMSKEAIWTLIKAMNGEVNKTIMNAIT